MYSSHNLLGREGGRQGHGGDESVDKRVVQVISFGVQLGPRRG